MSKQQFSSMLEENGLSLSPRQLEQFQLYFRTLVEWNEKMNLTAITSEDDVYLKHFYDSLTVAHYFDFKRPLNILDVGAGAGFPSLPLKICFSNLNISIVDSLNKRITFLRHLANTLSLERVNVYHERAETFAQQKEHREKYDVVIARAVARMPVLAELCLPFTKVGGHFIAMKGSNAPEEVEEGKRAIALLGGEMEKVEQFALPIEESTRTIIKIKKRKATSKKYPRKAGTPSKQPLL